LVLNTEKKGSVMSNPIDRVTALANTQSDYSMGEAVVYFEKDGEFTPVITDGDVYTALAMVKALGSAMDKDGLAVVTTGWAAPLNNDGEVEGAPSHHPARRRVRLVAYINNEGTASALSFQDDDEMIVDEGSATGSLADALADAWAGQ